MTEMLQLQAQSQVCGACDPSSLLLRAALYMRLPEMHTGLEGASGCVEPGPRLTGRSESLCISDLPACPCASSCRARSYVSFCIADKRDAKESKTQKQSWGGDHLETTQVMRIPCLKAYREAHHLPSSQSI